MSGKHGRASLRFLGAAGTVTGSKHLVETPDHRILLDCGLFEGPRTLRQRNWEEPGLDPAALDAVILSHAHIDHTGYLPRLVRSGYQGPVYCTSATRDLLEIMLLDSAHLQEQDARWARRLHRSGRNHAQPLYTTEDAQRTLTLVQTHGYAERFEPAAGIEAMHRRAGHILGSSTVELAIGDPPTTIVFTGDLGRRGRPILRDPDPVRRADVLLLESTYGDRRHEPDPVGELARIVNEAAERRGALLIPAFAVGRTQEIVWRLRQLEDAGVIPSLAVFIDSPMAIDVTEIYCKHPEDHDLDMKILMDEKRCPLCCRQYHLARTTEESKALNSFRGPLIIVSASGMATGGRILHHMKHRLPDPRTTVLFVGYQAAGTRGRKLQEGAPRVRIHGEDVPVRARIETLHGLSAHADRDEILEWLDGFDAPPRVTHVVHGEPEAAAALARTLGSERGWTAHVAEDGERVVL